MVLVKIGENMKKGFTLVELLGVFSIMAAVLLLSVPAVTNMLKKATENRYHSYEQDIFLAAEAYISTNRDIYPELREENKITYVRINTLLASNYLKSTMLNPVTNKKVVEEANNVVTVYMNEKGIYVYSYIVIVTEEETAAINAYEALTENATNSEIEAVRIQVNALSSSNIRMALLNKLGE